MRAALAGRPARFKLIGSRHRNEQVLAALAVLKRPIERLGLMLLERNRAWIPELVPQLEEGRAFVAVGLGHLLGEGSVVALLREQGYEVRRMGGSERPPARPSLRNP